MFSWVIISRKLHFHIYYLFLGFGRGGKQVNTDIRALRSMILVKLCDSVRNDLIREIVKKDISDTEDTHILPE
jgi:hypothetical protein